MGGAARSRRTGRRSGTMISGGRLGGHILLGKMLLLWGKGHVGHFDQAVGLVMPDGPLRVRKRHQHKGGKADDGQAYRHFHLRP
jgi:hypothetical protein